MKVHDTSTLVLVSLFAALAIANANPAAASGKKPAVAAVEPGTVQKQRRKAVSAVKSWGIQLRYLNRVAIAASPLDMIVIDHAPHPKKDVEIPFAADEIAPLKIKPDGTRRIVLSYLSIGEAERYRYYWKPEWDAATTRPQWLGAENPAWPGDYLVRFGDPEWQRIIFGTPDSYLDRILAAGFDGIFLDRVDAYQDIADETAGAEDAMTSFVIRLADYARRTKPDFLIVMQNAEELAESKPLVTRLDAMAKEDLMYGHGNSEEANPPPMLRDTLLNLRRAKKQGLKIFALEYVTAPEKVAAVRALSRNEGFVLHLTERLLGTLSIEGQAPASAANPVPAPQ